MGIGKRIKEARSNKGLTQEELAKLVGVTKGAIANYENEASHPKEPVMYALINALGVDANFLFQDCVSTIPQKYKPTAPEPDTAEAVAKRYKRLDRHGKQVVCAVLDEEARRMEAKATGGNTVEKIVYTYPAAAGIPLYAENDYERLEFPESEVPYGADFGVRISGRSMEPTIKDGSIVWVKKTPELKHGQIGVFMLDDSAVCKRLYNKDGLFRLDSDNPEYKSSVITEFTQFGVVGQVIGYS